MWQPADGVSVHVSLRFGGRLGFGVLRRLTPARVYIGCPDQPPPGPTELKILGRAGLESVALKGAIEGVAEGLLVIRGQDWTPAEVNKVRALMGLPELDAAELEVPVVRAPAELTPSPRPLSGALPPLPGRGGSRLSGSLPPLPDLARLRPKDPTPPPRHDLVPEAMIVTPRTPRPNTSELVELSATPMAAIVKAPETPAPPAAILKAPEPAKAPEPSAPPAAILKAPEPSRSLEPEPTPAPVGRATGSLEPLATTPPLLPRATGGLDPVATPPPVRVEPTPAPVSRATTEPVAGVARTSLPPEATPARTSLPVEATPARMSIPPTPTPSPSPRPNVSRATTDGLADAPFRGLAEPARVRIPVYNVPLRGLAAALQKQRDDATPLLDLDGVSNLPPRQVILLQASSPEGPILLEASAAPGKKEGRVKLAPIPVALRQWLERQT